ncbi:hypothetical protein [Streptosporangium lutulentum]|uniref:Uncharacterized protein n=1 Tax=Streptosporangium lutulentum TaxID=1461250 RepID=A0ABT9QQ32_9ACTN|nr:hypothetical protein [Streptosporangium lutulentum]MDP9848004.1 hypothetical protein [Streptosporangium lutulentum]
MAAEPIVIYQGKRYRLWEGRILLDWSKRLVPHHREGCVLCCTVRVTTGPGSPLRHPKNCTNCMTYPGPRPDPCWSCGTTAHFRDDAGRPTHKVCLETNITAAALAKSAPTPIAEAA